MDAAGTRDRLELGRPLTHPTEGMKNHGWDNKNDDLIVFTGDVLEPPGCSKRYIVEDALGHGTFGQVVKCRCSETKKKVAIKIIKNQDAYFQQARVEVGILKLLRDNYPDKYNVVKILEYFVFREHLCLVFELLDANLYDLLKRNGYRGLSIQLVRYFVRQLLDALITLRDERIIHCDIKPENILLQDQTNSGRVKLIDFGSACLEHKTVYNYIQSRFYRSPEVVVGYPYSTAIDMWSLGCVAAELFLGLPLFPAASERDLLARISEALGPLPNHVLERAKHNTKYYRPPNDQDNSCYQLLTEDEFKILNKISHPSGKHYFTHTRLPDVLGEVPIRQGLSEEEAKNENDLRLSFTDFLLGVLEVDPHTRWTPHQAALHPFIKGEAFVNPYQPLPSPEPRGMSNPLSIAIPNPKTHGHSASWHPDAGAFSTSFLHSPELHAQAHMAAMAAMNQISPQIRPQIMQQHVPGSLPVGYGNHIYQSGPHSLGRHGVRGGVDTMGRPIGEMRMQNQPTSQMSFGQGLSPGSYGHVLHPCGANQMPQMSPTYSVAMAAAYGSLNRSSGGMSLPSAQSQLTRSHANQNGMALSGLPGTSPIVGFTVPQNLPQTSSGHMEPTRLGNAQAQLGNYHGSFRESFGSMPVATNQTVHNDPVSLSFDSLSLGGTAGEIGSAARVSDIGDDDGLDADPNFSDQEFVLGPFEVQGESRDLPGAQRPQFISSNSSASYSEPYCAPHLPNVLQTGGEPHVQRLSSSCLGEMHQQMPLNGGFLGRYSDGDASISSQSVHIDDVYRRYPHCQPHVSSGIATEHWVPEPMHHHALSSCPSAPRSISQMPHSGISNLGATDAGYVRRRSQTDSFSNYLPVLQENQPVAVKDLRDYNVHGLALSSCHAHPAVTSDNSWTNVDEPRFNCGSADGRPHGFAQNDGSLPCYSNMYSNVRFSNGGPRAAGNTGGIGLQAQLGSTEQEIRPVLGQATSRHHVP